MWCSLFLSLKNYIYTWASVAVPVRSLEIIVMFTYLVTGCSLCLHSFPRPAAQSTGCADRQHDRRIGCQHRPRLGESAGNNVWVQLQPSGAVRQSDEEAGRGGGGTGERQTTTAEEEGGSNPAASGDTHTLLKVLCRVFEHLNIGAVVQNRAL